MISRPNVNPYFHEINLNIWRSNAPKYERFFNFMRTVRFLSAAFLVLLSLGVSTSGNSQIYDEFFGFEFDCSSQGNPADGFNPGNGPWSVAPTGFNGPLANRWYISNSVVGGGFVGDCINNCAGGGGVVTLHIGNATGIPDQGSVYDETGSGIPFQTNSRVQSPVIDCTGSFNNTLTVRFAHNSPNPNDIASIVYTADGITWANLQDLTNSGLCPPFGPNMVWNELTIPLPASANNNPNVQIGFNWRNDDTESGVGLRQSVAIDFVSVDAGPAPGLPAPAFSVVDNNVDFCEQSCITFISETTFDPLSSGLAVATYAWQFPGAVPATSTAQNPTNICYNEPGIYNVTLSVTDDIGTGGPITQNAFINVQECGPTIVVSIDNPTPCSGEQCVTLNSDESLGDINSTTWVWTFVSESGLDIVTSNQANPTNVCLNEVGFYDVTVFVENVAGITEEVELTNFIEVLDCFGPEIEFAVSQQTICVGSCVEFTNTSSSSSPITEWDWTLSGGQAVGEDEPGVSSQENPEVCYDVAGSYWAVLSATDAQGPSARPDSILITVDPCDGPIDPNFAASETVICAGDCVDFSNQTLGSQTGYTWIFNGSTVLTSIEENPMVVCYNTAGSFDVTLIVEDEIETTQQITIQDYITVENCVNPPVPRISVSQDTVCAGKCVDFFDESTGLGTEFFEHEWVFAGAVEGSQTSTDADPSQVCYNSPGTYDVVLKIVRPTIPDSATQVFTDVITVVSTPECLPTVIPSIPDTICAGDCAFFSADFIDADSVRWTFNGGNPETSTAFEPGLVCFPAAGEYLVFLQAYNEAGEAPTVFRTVTATERPPLNAGPDITINAGAEVELTAGLGGQVPNGTFLWQPFDQVDNFTSQTVNVSPDETTSFIVYYDQDSSCTAVDTVNVTVNFVAAIGVPNSFSPNGDGRNDVLRVLGQGITRMEFKIFNRYGQLVFETTNQSEGWDGLHNDKELNAGTFVYTLEVSFAEGSREVYTGDITLVR
jgi:gliding motility-associated-like protein